MASNVYPATKPSDHHVLSTVCDSWMNGVSAACTIQRVRRRKQRETPGEGRSVAGRLSNCVTRRLPRPARTARLRSHCGLICSLRTRCSTTAVGTQYALTPCRCSRSTNSVSLPIAYHEECVGPIDV